MLLKWKTYLPLCCAGLLFVGVEAWGQEGQILQASEVQVTAGRVERELLDVPMAVSVVTEEEIKKSGARTVGELLQDVPGVQVESSGSQGLKRVSIRGENPNRVLILVDGQKIAENKSMDGAALLISPSMVERIEVIKGPSSVLYGSEAIGGVVNIITRKGGSAPMQGEFTFGLNGATGGFSESVAAYGAMNGFKYRLSGNYTDQGRLRTPIGKAPHSGFLQWSGSGFLSYDFNESLTVGGSFEQFRSHIKSGTVDSPEFFVDIRPWDRKKAAVFAELRDVFSVMPRLRLDAFWQENRKNMHNHVEPASIIKLDNYADNTNKQLGASIQADWLVGDNHYLITGYEFSQDGLDATTNTYTNMRMGPMQRLTHSQYDYEGDVTTHALFALMESQLPMDFTLSYGVRQTWVQSRLTKADGRQRINGGADSALHAGIVGKSTASKPVFNVSLMWQGIENFSLRAGFAQGFRVPSLQDKYIISSMGGGVVEPNPGLKPESSNSFELGARYAYNAWNFDVTGFYSVAKDYIASQTINLATNTSRYVNMNQAKSHGVELAASYTFPIGLSPYAGVTWIRRQFDNGSWKTWNSGTPEWTGRAGLRLLYPLDSNIDLIGDAYVRFASASKQDSGSANSRTTTKIKGWSTANLSTGLVFGEKKQYSFTAEVLNIFNAKYSVRGSIYEPGVHVNVRLSMTF